MVLGKETYFKSEEAPVSDDIAFAIAKSRRAVELKEAE